MDLTRWEPRGLGTLRRQMDRLFDSFMAPEPFFDGEPLLRLHGDWRPVVDLAETDGEIVVKAELPGMNEEDVSVTISGDHLVIKGKREAEEETKDKQFHRIERSYGTFERTLPVPVSVDQRGISAEYSKGILEIHLPKKPEEKPKAIKVKAGK